MPVSTRLLRHHRRRRNARGLSGALTVVLLTTGIGLPFMTPALAQAGTRSSSGPAGSDGLTTVGAIAEAKETGKPVDIPALTTPTQTVTADPSGTLTLNQSLYPTRVRQNGAWEPVDPSLHLSSDGRLEPEAVPSGITLSGGGDGPLAVLTSMGKRLAISWPGTLPKPTVADDTATYAEVMPGVDLEVTVSPLGGFSEVLVVKNAAAAADPRLSSLVLDTSTTGLTVTADATGNLKATDPAQAAFFTSPAAMMWDSTTTTSSSASAASPAASSTAQKALAGTAKSSSPASSPSDATASSSADAPGHGARIAQIPARVSADHLTITPDSDVLHGPQTHYPVYIDPSWNPAYASDPKTAYDEVQQGCPGKNALNSSTVPYNTPGVGMNGYSDCIGREEAYFQFKVDTRLWNSLAHVVNATFKSTEVYSASCSVSSDVRTYLTGTIGTGTTWNTKPALGTLQDTQTYGSACTNAPSKGFDVTDALTKAAAGHWSAVAFAMVAADESDPLHFRRFANNPTLTVQYDTAPAVSSASTSPDAATIGHTTVTLNAYVTDADQGAPIQAKFTLKGKDAGGNTVYPVSGSPGQPVVPSTTVTQSGNISWKVGYLPTGSYTWTVQADDGKYLSTVKTYTFKVDATAPGTPTVVAPAIDAGTTPAARTQIEFDIYPPADGKDIVKYAYNWGMQPPTVNPPLTIAAKPNGAMTPLLSVPNGFLHDVLYVYAVDSAGNQSGSYALPFNVLPPDASDITGDLSGDGKPDLVTPGADGNLRLYPATGAGGLAGPVNLYVKQRGDTTDFTDAKIAVGAFRSSGAEQDVLVVTKTGQADIYAGNGDAEPLPCSVETEGCSSSELSQAAILADATFTWSQVTQLTADDSQYASRIQPNLWVTTSDGSLYWLHGTPATGVFDSVTLLATGWQNKTIAYAGVVGGYPALWARDTASGELDLYTGTADAPAGSPTSTKTVTATSGWSSATRADLYSAGGANAGTGTPDVWAADTQAVHNVFYHPAGTTAGTLAAGTRVQTISPSDDFTSDGQADILAGWNDGTLHLYTGQGAGRLTDGRQIWDSSWGATKLMVSGDFNGDGKGDVISEWSNGSLHLYTGTGTGGLNTASPELYGSTTWGSVKQLIAGDFNGDSKTDLAAVWSDGTLHLYRGDGQGNLTAPTSMWGDASWNSVRLLAAGDYTSDGNADIIAEWNDGTLHSYIGDGNGKLTAGKQMIGGTTWTTVTHLIPGDFSGDGKTDLAAVWGDGTLHLYTGDGNGNLSTGVTMWNDNSWSTVRLTA